MLRGLFLVTLLSVLFQQGANFALEYGLEQLFSQQTGCDVTLDNTSINFFIARGTAKNVRFVCSDEKPGEELNVSQISVFISPLQLLRKRVVLSDLRLVGAKISSLQENSGFNRLMSFLFTPPKPDTGEDWHSFISEGWDVSVGDVDIASKTDEGVSLTVTYPGLRVSAKSVSFSVKGTPKGAASPIFVDGNDIELSIDQGDGWKYFLQDASVAGELSKGKVRILKSKLVLPSSENDEAAVVSPVFDLDYTKGLRVEGSIAANGSPED